MSEKAPTITALIRGPTLFKGGVRTMAEMLVGDPVGLQREPENPYDGNAVLCLKLDTAFGYIDRDSAAKLALWMDKGWVYTANIIKAGDVLKNKRGKIGVRVDSVVVKCVPIQPISLKKTVKESKPVARQLVKVGDEPERYEWMDKPTW